MHTNTIYMQMQKIKPVDGLQWTATPMGIVLK